LADQDSNSPLCARAALLAVLLLGLAACATTPQTASLPSLPSQVPISLGTPVAASTDSRAASAPAGAPAAKPAKPAGDSYRDVLDRLRAGYALEPVDEPRIDRETEWFLRHPDYIERTLNRAAPYLHHIISEVERRGLPAELAVLPIIESAYEPYAYSSARAAGLWQFIPATGTRFGLKQNWWYDGRRDVVSATRAALDYLEWLHNMFNGDWLLAIAAYNCGEMAVDRQVRANIAAGKPADFWNLKLPAETRAYVPKLLAMSRLVGNPAAYGLEFSGIPNEPFFVSVETGGQIDMAVAAKLAGLDTSDLYALNPAFHRFATDPAGPHFLLLPIESAEAFRQNLLQLTEDQRMRVERYEVRKGDTVAGIAKRFGTTPAMIAELNGLPAKATVAADAELRVPSAVFNLPPKVLAAAALVDGRGSLKRASSRQVHVVARGDSLSAIARKTGVPVASLLSLNGLKPSATLRAGQTLMLGTTTSAAVPEKVSEPAPVKAAKADKGKPKPAKVNAKAAPASAPAGKQVTYVVRAGDTLFAIARALEVSVADLRNWNRLSQADAIQPGQKLVAFNARKVR
jgi:membrane-bound lytic murein transglycosylase D